MTNSPDATKVVLVDVIYEDTDFRCRDCYKRLVIDVGFGVFGEHEGYPFCLNCGRPPEVGWALFQFG